jgi:hypothetical protein
MGFAGSEPRNLAVSTNANGALINGANGVAYAVLGYSLSVSAAMAVKFQTNATDLCGALRMATNGTLIHPPGSTPLFQTNTGEPLNVNISAAGIVSGHITYVTVTP